MGNQTCRIRKFNLFSDSAQCDRAIHRAGIKEDESKGRGNLTCDAAFARTSWSIDGYYHADDFVRDDSRSNSSTFLVRSRKA